MSVPNTTTFNQQNVEDEIPEPQGSLVDSFADAHPDGFDPNYSGFKNSLLNFRNYTHVTDSVSCSPSSLTIMAGMSDSTIVSSTGSWTASLHSDPDNIVSSFTASGINGDSLSVTMVLKSPGTYSSAIIRLTCGTASFDLVVDIIA